MSFVIAGADIRRAKYDEIERELRSIQMPDGLWAEASATAYSDEEAAEAVFYFALSQAVQVVDRAKREQGS